MSAPKILVFAGSTRSGALSGKVAALAARELSLIDAYVTHISLADYPLPIYDGDHEDAKGVPDNATKLARMIAAHGGVFVATPEYNRSLPPLLKNALDWVSRVDDPKIAYRGRVYALAASSDGRFGGARAIIDLRKVIGAAVGGLVIAEQIEFPNADEAFNESGELYEEAPSRALKRVCQALVDTTRHVAD